MRRKRWAVIGVALTLVVGFVTLAAWSRADRWPPRWVIPLPPRSWPQGFSPDGRSYLAADESGWFAWDLATGKVQESAEPPKIWNRSDAADGRTYVGVGTTFTDRGESEVVWVNSASDAIRARFPVRANLFLKLVLVGGGRSIRAVLGHFDQVRQRISIKEVMTWDLASGAEVRRPIAGPVGEDVEPMAYSRDARLCAYLDRPRGMIQVWDLEADRPEGEPLPASNVPLSQLPSAVFTSDGQTLIVGRNDGRLAFYSLAESRLVKTFKVHPADYLISGIGLSPDGRTLTSTGVGPSQPSRLTRFWWACLDRIIPDWSLMLKCETVVIEVETGRVLARSSGSVTSRFSPDGRTIVTREWNWTLTARDAPQPGSR